MSAATAPAGPAGPAGPAAGLSLRRPFGDRAFNLLALGSGLLVLVILVLIALTMTNQSTLWFRSAGWSGVFSTDWDPAHGKFGAMAFVFGTVVTSVIAIIFAVPVSVGVALLLTEVVPRRWAQPVVYVIDLLAVVPSVVWGLWGILVLAPWLRPIYNSISSGVAGIPVLDDLFGGQPVSGRRVLHRGNDPGRHDHANRDIAVCEVIATVPTTDKEGAYALGATKWEMIRGAVWPHSQTGVVGAVLLGLGRAMGETIAAALVIGSSATVTSHLFFPGYSMPAVIANQFGEASA